jgi:transcriptional regulator with XRE-family HTH domain
MADRPARTSATSTGASHWRSLVERVRGTLATKNLTIYRIAALSRLRHPHESSYHLPHNFYFQLESAKWSPTIQQLAALAEFSNYRLVDWLDLFGFHWDQIAQAQAALPRPRTALLDGRVHNINTRIPWFRDRLRYDAILPVAPLSQILDQAGKFPVSMLPFPTESSDFLYAKIGQQDAFAFPDLMPGSIVRANFHLAARYLRQAGQPDSNYIFLVEHQGGVCCCRLHFGATNRITLLPTQLPFASVEVELGSEARILGLVDLELRPLLKTRKRGDPICAFPDVAPELARHWTPGTLKKDIFEAPAHLLRNARMRAGLSFRTASTMSREIARTLGDERHYTSQGSLSDYEASDRPPRHLHKLFSLCILYAIPFSALLKSYAINATIGSNRVPAEWMLEQEEPESTNSPLAPIPGLLDENLKRIRELPFFVRHSLSLLSGLPDLSLHDVFWVGGQTQPMHPALSGALLAVVNRRKTTPPAFLRKSLWEQPLYLVLRRDGSYLLANCTLEDNSIIAHPHADGFVPHERFRNRLDGEVLGQIYAVVRSLRSPRRVASDEDFECNRK